MRLLMTPQQLQHDVDKQIEEETPPKMLEEKSIHVGDAFDDELDQKMMHLMMKT